jgi:hypothetical protein
MRYDSIDVTLTSTENRDFVSLTRQDNVGEATTGVFVDNSTQWTSWFRSVLGLRFDYFTYSDTSNIPENSGQTTANITSPKLALVFGRGPRRILRGRGIRLSQQRRARVFTVIDPKSGTGDRSRPRVRTKVPSSASERRSFPRCRLRWRCGS